MTQSWPACYEAFDDEHQAAYDDFCKALAEFLADDATIQALIDARPPKEKTDIDQTLTPITVKEYRAELNAFATDANKIRYILGYHKADEALKRMTETVLWRLDFEVAKISASNMKDELELGLMYCYKTLRSKQGNPIVVHTKSKKAGGDPTLAVQKIVVNLEKATSQMEGGAGYWVYVMDLSGYTSKNSPPWAVTKQCIHVFSNHFPERLEHFYMVNAPWIFRTLWAMASPFIDKKTKAKISFVKASEGKPAPELLERIDAESLEKRFGGNLDYTYSFESEEGDSTSSLSAAMAGVTV